MAPNYKKKKNSSPEKCTRCNRTGHTKNTCYAETYADGNIIDDSDEECDYDSEEEYFLQTGDIVETKKKARNSYKKNTNSYSNFNKKCYRCGRAGHYSSNCYASKHKNGYYLS